MRQYEKDYLTDYARVLLGMYTDNAVLAYWASKAYNEGRISEGDYNYIRKHRGLGWLEVTEESNVQALEDEYQNFKKAIEAHRGDEVEENIVRHRELLDDLHETYCRKNEDYGDSFSQSLDKRGLVAALVRMEDKINRVDTLKDKEDFQVDESLQDSLLDLANYAIMSVMWLQERAEDGVSGVVYADNQEYFKVKKE